MKIVSLILARGGSKGIPNKNIIDLNGKPLIQYSINASNKSQSNETWVSTDSPKIKDMSKTLGAYVIDRPAKLAQDTSQSEDAILHFCNTVEFDILVFIQPTSPLLQSQDINKGLDLLLAKEEQYDSVFSVYKEHWIPRWNSRIEPINWDPQKRPRRQDVQETYVENGAFYITSKTNLVQSKLRYSGKKGFIEMPLSRSFQIDTHEDLELMKKLL